MSDSIAFCFAFFHFPLWGEGIRYLVFTLLRVKSPPAEGFAIPLEPKYDCQDNVLYENLYILGEKKKFKPRPQNKILVPF